MKLSVAKSLEWFGVITAIVYSLLVASNIGLEFIGFSLLLVSSFSIGLWAYLVGTLEFCCFSFSMAPQESLGCCVGFKNRERKPLLQSCIFMT